jgi:hypothetical protein
VGGVLGSGVMLDTDPPNRYRLLRNYLNAFEAELENKRLLTSSAFFEAILEMFNTVVQNAINLERSVKQPSLQKIVQPLAKLEYRGSGGGSVLSKRAIVELMQSALRARTAITADML